MKNQVFERLNIILAGVTACVEFFRPILTERSSELLVVAFCNDECELISMLWYPGDAEEVEAPLNEILSEAILLGARGMVLAHNHPSEIAKLSPGDIQISKRLSTVCSALDMTLIDHIVFAGNDHYSARRCGLI